MMANCLFWTVSESGFAIKEKNHITFATQEPDKVSYCSLECPQPNSG